ncbi:hypothetical protein EDC02_3806 [Micromonospora sp. Llam0]|uniref:hypothetical protein n=1 Tax=Micromonospora sp. Llam0 TaxID=2485143 RepID=UPI000FACE61D|nr:hypothetical protein [Micromonospora sp. Llam0]ROO61849.1 hypothetical protein EDC02_3806 [Micromonospora sp. Llam0]
MSCTPMLWPQRRERWRRRWVAASLAAILTAALLVADSDPAIAKHGPPDGASTSRPSQDAGSAAGRHHKVAGDETAAEGSIPPGNPPLPPGAEGVVGRERLAPDPGDSLEQCRPCPTGTTPQLPPRDAAPVDEGAVTLTPGAAPSGYVEGRSRELPETRTATSTTFVNPDGTKTLRMYSGPAFARDVAGNMVPMDTQVQRRDDGRLRPQTCHSPHSQPTQR